MIANTPDAHLVLPYSAVLQQNYNPVFSRQFLLCCRWQVCCGILCVSKHLKGFLLQRSSESLRRMPKGGRREEPPSGFQTVFRGAQGFPGGTARSSTGGPRERPCKDNAKRGPSPHLLSLIFIPLNEGTAQTIFETPFTRGGDRTTLSVPHCPACSGHDDSKTFPLSIALHTLISHPDDVCHPDPGSSWRACLCYTPLSPS